MILPRALPLVLAALAASCGGDGKPSAPAKAPETKAAAAKPSSGEDPGGGGLDLASLKSKEEGTGPTAPPAPAMPTETAAPGKPAAPPEAAKAPAAPEGPPPPASPSEITDTEVLATWSADEREALAEMPPADRAKEMEKKRLEIFKARGGVLIAESGRMEEKEVDAATGLRGPARPTAVKPEDLPPTDLLTILDDLGSKDPEARARGAESALRFPDKSVAARHVVKLLEDPDPELRAIAASTLGALQQSSSIPALVKVLEKGDKDAVRAMALRALKDIGGQEAVAELRKVVAEGMEPSDRAAALGMLVDLKETGGVRGLLRGALGDLAPEVRQAAVVALRELDIRDYEKEMIPLLKDFSDQVIIDTLRTMGATKARSAVGEIVKILVKPHEESEDPEAIQKAANDALEQITGLKKGYSDTVPEAERLAAIDAWRVWWQKNKATWK